MGLGVFVVFVFIIFVVVVFVEGIICVVDAREISPHPAAGCLEPHVAPLNEVVCAAASEKNDASGCVALVLLEIKVQAEPHYANQLEEMYVQIVRLGTIRLPEEGRRRVTELRDGAAGFRAGDRPGGEGGDFTEVGGDDGRVVGWGGGGLVWGGGGLEVVFGGEVLFLVGHEGFVVGVVRGDIFFFGLGEDFVRGWGVLWVAPAAERWIHFGYPLFWCLLILKVVGCFRRVAARLLLQ